jgi:hypothetical protein
MALSADTLSLADRVDAEAAALRFVASSNPFSTNF